MSDSELLVSYEHIMPPAGCESYLGTPDGVFNDVDLLWVESVKLGNTLYPAEVSTGGTMPASRAGLPFTQDLGNDLEGWTTSEKGGKGSVDIEQGEAGRRMSE
jgi:hypothetical protein